MITAIDLISALVGIVLDVDCFVICFKQNTVCEGGTLLLLVDIDAIGNVVSLIGGHKINRLLMVLGESVQLVSLLVEFIVLFEVVLRIVNKLDKVRVLRLESHIQITHDEVVVSTRIWLKLILRFLHVDSPQCCSQHIASLGALLHSCDQVAIYKTECPLVQTKFKHQSALVANQVHDAECDVVGLA